MAERLLNRRTLLKIAGGVLSTGVGLDYARNAEQERQAAEAQDPRAQHTKNVNERPSETTRRSVILLQAKTLAGGIVAGYGVGNTSIEVFKLMGLINSESTSCVRKALPHKR